MISQFSLITRDGLLEMGAKENVYILDEFEANIGTFIHPGVYVYTIFPEDPSYRAVLVHDNLDEGIDIFLVERLESDVDFVQAGALIVLRKYFPEIFDRLMKKVLNAESSVDDTERGE